MKFLAKGKTTFKIEANGQHLSIWSDCFVRKNPLDGFSPLGLKLKNTLRDIYGCRVDNKDLAKAYREWSGEDQL